MLNSGIVPGLRLTGDRGSRAIILAVVGVLVCAVSSASASLPDGRAWEMVSPLNKNGGDIRGIEGHEVNNGSGMARPVGDNGGGVVEASADGERVTYVSLVSFADGSGAPIGSQYVSSRGSEGWLTQNISTPTNNQTYILGGRGVPYDAFSVDLSNGLELNGSGGGGTEHPVETAPLAGAPAGYQDYYLDEIHYPGALSLRSLLSSEPSQPSAKFVLEFEGATQDLTHIDLVSEAKLAPEAVEVEHEENMYEWEKATGQFQMINLLPDGTPGLAGTLLLGGAGGATDHAISNDGLQVVWTAPSALYVRMGIGTQGARTVQADASQGGSDSSGGGRFLTASSSSGAGSKVFFLDHRRLTSDSTAGNEGDLYEFEPENGPIGKLTDLTVEREHGGSAEVRGVLGASEDGSYLYFVATGALAPGAEPGAYNLYLWHEGEPIRFIAALSVNDENRSGTKALGVAFDWESQLGLRTTRVSPDGTHLLFMSERSLTGYDNTASNGVNCGKNAHGQSLPAHCEEVFLFDAKRPGSGMNPVCISCNPSGGRPTGPSGIQGATEYSNNSALYVSRVLSEDGSRVFFESDDGLVTQDTNGEGDVYEWENGRAYLLSSGTSPEGTSFVDASANGSDVFFITRAQLAGQDTDQLVDLYDARAPHGVGERVGSLGSPPLVPCEGEGCRAGASGEPGYSLPSSVLFSGSGNVIPAPPSAAKSVAKHPARKVKPRKRRKRARHARRANRNVGRALRALAGLDISSKGGR